MYIYTVRAGDSVYQIARAGGVNANAIISANGLQSPDQIFAGQSLIIPAATRNYIVRPGDTLRKIAQKAGVLLQQVLQLNPQITNPNSLFAGQVLRLPSVRYGDIVVNGYCYPSIKEEVLADDLPHLSMLSVFGANVRANGDLTPMTNDARVIQKTKAAGVRPHLVITNLEEGKGFSQDIAGAVLRSPAAQANLLEQCMHLMRGKGYTGLDVDFEYVPAALRENLNCFLAKARAWMHDEGFLLTSAIPPKRKDDETGALTEGFDYWGEGKYNDYITIMTYEWGYQGGPPMAVAPVNEIRKVLDYAVTRMPRQKILMGIPNYGYDWKIPYTQGTNATVIQNPGGVAIAGRYGAEINYDDKSETPWFRYTESNGQQHEVWFEDARSIAAKLALVQEYGLGGVSYWTVNYPFAQNWTLLEDLYRVGLAHARLADKNTPP
jgi:spore germination protein